MFEKVELSKDVTLYRGDCLEVMKTLPDGSVNCIATSPPYFGLRDYKSDGQIGLESTPQEYVARLVAVFTEARRVLRDDGTLWLNFGDSYATTKEGNTNGTYGKVIQKAGVNDNATKRSIPPGLKPKDLIGIPWRVAFALQDSGWWLRQDIIWAKPNPMPESVTDRCTKAHEYIFLLTKSARYWYDAEAVKEPFSDDRMGNPGGGGNYVRSVAKTGFRNDGATLGSGVWNEDGAHVSRNRRSVWTVATSPYSGAHFATWPPKLVEPMILAGCPAKCCPKCGAGWERLVERVAATSKPCPKTNLTYQAQCGNGANRTGTIGMSGGGRVDGSVTTTGWRPTCACGIDDTVPGVVLDPFAGSGTTLAVAQELGRRGIGIDISADYIELAKRRIEGARVPLFVV